MALRITSDCKHLLVLTGDHWRLLGLVIPNRSGARRSWVPLNGHAQTCSGHMVDGGQGAQEIERISVRGLVEMKGVVSYKAEFGVRVSVS